MDKIRLLFCIESLAPHAGTERQIEELVHRLDKSRFEIHVASFDDSPRLQSLPPDAIIRVFPFTSIYRPNGWLQMLRLRRYIIKNRIDIIQTFIVKANLAGTLAAITTPARIISSRRNLGYCMTPFYFRFFQFLDRFTTRILANSQCAKQFTIDTEHVSPDRVDVLYNAIDFHRYAPGQGDPAVARKLGIPDTAKVVGIVASLRPVKGHTHFLRAAQIVAQRVPDAAFLIVGQGELRDELARLAAELGIADKVYFADDHGTVQDHLRRIDIGCLASESESFSNAILEYMANGLPVVATDVGGNPEAVIHGETGFIVPYGDPAAMAAPLIQLLTDDALRAQMGRKGLERCHREYDIDTIIRQHEDYYTRIAAMSKT